MAYNVRVDIEELTLDDLVALEEGSVSTRILRDLISRFLVDDDGNPIPEEDAIKIAGKMRMREMKEVATALTDEIKRIKDETIPPVNAVG